MPNDGGGLVPNGRVVAPILVRRIEVVLNSVDDETAF